MDRDMEADTQSHVAFFLTGRRQPEHLDAVDGLDLRPALFAGYRELSQLRYGVDSLSQSQIAFQLRLPDGEGAIGEGQAFRQQCLLRLAKTP